MVVITTIQLPLQADQVVVVDMVATEIAALQGRATLGATHLLLQTLMEQVVGVVQEQ